MAKETPDVEKKAQHSPVFEAKLEEMRKMSDEDYKAFYTKKLQNMDVGFAEQGEDALKDQELDNAKERDKAVLHMMFVEKPIPFTALSEETQSYMKDQKDDIGRQMMEYEYDLKVVNNFEKMHDEMTNPAPKPELTKSFFSRTITNQDQQQEWEQTQRDIAKWQSIEATDLSEMKVQDTLDLLKTSVIPEKFKTPSSVSTTTAPDAPAIDAMSFENLRPKTNDKGMVEEPVARETEPLPKQELEGQKLDFELRLLSGKDRVAFVEGQFEIKLEKLSSGSLDKAQFTDVYNDMLELRNGMSNDKKREVIGRVDHTNAPVKSSIIESLNIAGKAEPADVAFEKYNKARGQDKTQTPPATETNQEPLKEPESLNTDWSEMASLPKPALPGTLNAPKSEPVKTEPVKTDEPKQGTQQIPLSNLPPPVLTAEEIARQDSYQRAEQKPDQAQKSEAKPAPTAKRVPPAPPAVPNPDVVYSGKSLDTILSSFTTAQEKEKKAFVETQYEKKFEMLMTQPDQFAQNFADVQKLSKEMDMSQKTVAVWEKLPIQVTKGLEAEQAGIVTDMFASIGDSANPESAKKVFDLMNTDLERFVNVVKANGEKSPEEMQSALVKAAEQEAQKPEPAKQEQASGGFKTSDHVRAEQRLIEAIKKGDLAGVQNAITGVYSINEKDKNGYTPLHEAVSSTPDTHKKAVIDELIKNGANVNAVNNIGETPLHLAANYADIEVTKTLISAGANVNLVDKNGKTPLDLANERMKDTSPSYKVEVQAVIDALTSAGAKTGVKQEPANPIAQPQQQPVQPSQPKAAQQAPKAAVKLSGANATMDKVFEAAKKPGVNVVFYDVDNGQRKNYVGKQAFQSILQNNASGQKKVLYAFGENDIDYDASRNAPTSKRKGSSGQAEMFNGNTYEENSKGAVGIVSTMYRRGADTPDALKAKLQESLQNAADRAQKEGAVLLVPAKFDDKGQMTQIDIGTGVAMKRDAMKKYPGGPEGFQADLQKGMDQIAKGQKVDLSIGQVQQQKQSQAPKAQQPAQAGTETKPQEQAKEEGPERKTLLGSTRLREAFVQNRYVKDIKGDMRDTYAVVTPDATGKLRPRGNPLAMLGNAFNAGCNFVGAALKFGSEMLGEGLKKWGKLMGEPLEKLRDVISDPEAGIGKKILAGVGMALVGAPLKAAGIGISLTGTVVKSVGEVAGNICGLTGAIGRAAISFGTTDGNAMNIWKQFTKTVASVAHIGTDLAKDVGGELKELGNQAGIPVVSQVLRIAGATVQGVGQATEGIVQGARKMAVAEFKEGGKLMLEGFGSGGKGFGKEVGHIFGPELFSSERRSLGGRDTTYTAEDRAKGADVAFTRGGLETSFSDAMKSARAGGKEGADVAVSYEANRVEYQQRHLMDKYQKADNAKIQEAAKALGEAKAVVAQESKEPVKEKMVDKIKRQDPNRANNGPIH